MKKRIIAVSIAAVLIFIISGSAALLKPKEIRSKELIITIDKTFDKDMFLLDLKDFYNYNKNTMHYKADWIYKLSAITSAYKDHFRNVCLIKRTVKNEAIFTTVRGEIFFFSDGKMLPPEDLTADRNYHSYLYSYPAGRKWDKPNMSFFPKPADFAFFDSLYGSYPDERENNLEIFWVIQRKMRFNYYHHASSSLKAVMKEIEILSQKDKETESWLDSIQYIYTFISRDVKNANRASLHSYGIALDMLPEVRTKYIYWQWVKQLRIDWWNVKESEKLKVPADVIDIFEKHGFVWGGKWFFYDIMHFEYRPEIIEYARLLKEDPLKNSGF